MTPLRVNQTEAYLQTMLDQAGITPDAPDVYRMWSVFKAFARVPVVCQDDGFLFETLPMPEFNSFNLHFLRQFTLYDGDKYDHMEQLNCDFTYPLTDDLSSLQKVVWAYDFHGNLDAFFAHVEGLPAFQVPITQHSPTEMAFGQGPL